MMFFFTEVFISPLNFHIWQDILFSFLPLAHTLERCCELSVFMAGGAVGFYSGNLKTLTADMKALKPTILPAVPRSGCQISVFHHSHISFPGFLTGSTTAVSTLQTRAVFSGKRCKGNLFLVFRKPFNLNIQNLQSSRHVFNFALSSKTGELYKGFVHRDSIWDKLIFW